MGQMKVLEVPFKEIKPETYDYDKTCFEPSYDWTEDDKKAIDEILNKAFNETANSSKYTVETSQGVVTVVSERHPEYPRKRLIKGYIEQSVNTSMITGRGTQSQIPEEHEEDESAQEEEDSSHTTPRVENRQLNNYDIYLKNEQIIRISAFGYRHEFIKIVFLDGKEPPESFVYANEVIAVILIR